MQKGPLHCDSARDDKGEGGCKTCNRLDYLRLSIGWWLPTSSPLDTLF